MALSGTYVKKSGVEGGTSFGTIDGSTIGDIVLNGKTFDNIVFKNENTVSILKETFDISGSAATCTSAGTRIGTSRYDKKTESQYQAALGHYDGKTYAQSWGSNGCNTSGWSTTWCGRCGTQLSSSVIWSCGHKGYSVTEWVGYWATRTDGKCTPVYRGWWTCCNFGGTYW